MEQRWFKLIFDEACNSHFIVILYVVQSDSDHMSVRIVISDHHANLLRKYLVELLVNH